MASSKMREPTMIEPPRFEQSPPGLHSSLNRTVPHQTQEQLPKGPFQLVSTPKVLPAKTIRFWFRTRLIHANATEIEKKLPNVLLLRVIPSTMDRLIGMAVGLLPSPFRAWAEKFFAEWNLPPHLAIKTCKKDWDEEFEVEKLTYKEIKSLQGIRIPKYYGEFKYNETKAILLSDIGGACMGDPAGAILDMEEFHGMMKQALTDMARFGILPDDIRLENFHLVDDKVMVVDFEMVHKYESKEDAARGVKALTDWLAKLYQGRQQDFLDHGKITN